MLDLEKIFADNEEDFLKFKDVQNPLSPRNDLHAMLLIDSIVSSDKQIIRDADHDKIWFNVNIVEFAEKASAEQVIELIRCGVMLDDDNESLCMFV